MPIAENLDFLNQNSLRNFPLKEGVSASSEVGDFTIPESFMLDCVLAASSNITKQFYVSKIENTPETIVVELSDDANVFVGRFTIPVATHQNYDEYFLVSAGAYINANGKLTVGDLTAIKSRATGVFTFTLATAVLEMTCVVPSVSSINRVTIIDEKGGSHTVTGNIILIARNNLRFRKSITGNIVTLDAGDGLGLNKDCLNDLPCIRTIRNVAGDDDGNFVITGSDCAQFSEMSSPPGLLLQETCCKPCMGCDEISELAERVMHLEADLLKLKDYAQRTTELISQFSQTTNYNCEC